MKQLYALLVMSPSLLVIAKFCLEAYQTYLDAKRLHHEIEENQDKAE